MISGRHARNRSRLALVAAATLAMVISLLGASLPASAAVGVPVTYIDHAYNASVNRPSEDKPQSKLWFHDGSWWALMVVSGGTQVRIHRLNPATHAWDDTGAVVDTRLNRTGDALWLPAENKLYVASRAGTAGLLVTRFTYTGGARPWTVDAGFPKTVAGVASESVTIDKDSRGRFWVTFTQGARVWVTHSTDATGTSWAAPFQPPVGDTVIDADDLSSVIAFGSSIGVMWSDQQSGAFRFAIHNDADPDTVWRVEDATAGLNSVDDHINLKQLVGDPSGRIYAAVKTSANDPAGAKPTDPLDGVLTRTGSPSGTGTWRFATAGTVADDHTRPMIMIDATNQELYFFATSPGNGGNIVYKKAPLGNVVFPTGRGTPFVDAAPVVNNATGSKDAVTAQTGLVILAVAEGQNRYVHAEMALAGGGAPDTTAPTATTSPAAGATAVPASGNVTATFSESVQGVSGSTFTLKDTTTGAAVDAGVSYDDATKVATLDPAAVLADSTQYTATLTSGIHDAANNALTPVTWTFTTAGASTDTVAPTVTAVAPAANKTGFSRTGNVTATFSEPVQNVSGGTFVLRNATTGAVIPAVVSRSGTTNKWILNPSATLAARTRFTATVVGGANGVQDLSGNPLAADMTWTFTTGS